jgi:glycosyltransferase involved in cell wall biosynthesis
MKINNKSFTIVIPAKNEASNLEKLLPNLTDIVDNSDILVINDGSTDNTINVCANNKVNVITHPYSMGNGAAIKSGARNTSTEYILFMDADGQHPPSFVTELLSYLDSEYDMVIGARDFSGHANAARLTANIIYNKIASYMTGQKIDDLTSGFRLVKRSKFLEFLYMLPNGFSYPTTITMAFFKSGYSIKYHPFKAKKRIGKSHINILKDGARFFIIIFKIGSLYSPLKLFIPLSAISFILGLSYYLYTYISAARFTNMSALLFSTSILIFLIGLVSEQITTLLYSKSGKRN